MIIRKTGGGGRQQFLDCERTELFPGNVGEKIPNGISEAGEKYVHLYLENLVFFRHFRHSDGL